MSSDDETRTKPMRGMPVAAGAAYLVLRWRTGDRIAPLPFDAPVVIGRSQSADIVLDHPSLSRRHAEVCSTSEGVWLRDLGSMNATLVGGQRTERVLLADGERALLGEVEVTAQIPALRTDARPVGDARGLERWTAEQAALGRRVGVLALRPIVSPALLLAELRRDVGTDGVLGLGERGVVYAALLSTGFLDLEEVAERTIERGLACAGAVDVLDTAHRASWIEALTTALDSPGPSSLRSTRASRFELGEGLVVGSRVMEELYAQASRIARSSSAVLITGETGVGKDLVARFVHAHSARADRPFRVLACGSTPAGLLASELFGHVRGAFTGADDNHQGMFERASSGTLLLDGVAELDASAQAALLRVLETGQIRPVGAIDERPVDVRVIASTHRDLEAAMRTGAFRRDLYYRLTPFVIEVPPLRLRREELVPLVRHFALAGGHALRRLTPAAVARLEAHPWPGNVRELRNVVEHACMLARGPVIGEDDLPSRLTETPRQPGESRVRFADRVRSFEESLIRQALSDVDFNKAAAARALDIPLRTLTYKIKSFGIEPDA